MRVTTVIKRDGRNVPFSKDAIYNAVIAAMKEVKKIDSKTAQDIADEIAECDNDTLEVEAIQDMVENILMKSSYPEVAKAYILYRDKRNKARNSSSDSVILSIVNAEHNDITRENANMNADTPAGMMMKIASERSKEFVHDYLLSDDAKFLVDNNIIHVHDADYMPSKSLTCLQHPIDKILQSGFVAGHGESRAAKRIETASILACISMETIQNEMHGGQAIPAFDFYMAPYVRLTYQEEIRKIAKLANCNLDDLLDKKYDDFIILPLDDLYGRERFIQHAINETVRRVHQAMEAFVHNLNVIHSRGGNQVVFSSLNYGTDTSAEGRCVIRELLLTTERGVGNGSTAIFPIQIWKKKRGVSYLPEDRNYDLYQLACRVTAKRFFPNFVNLDATFNKHEKWDENDPKRYMYEVATMGCVDGDEVVTYRISGCVQRTEPIKLMYNRLYHFFGTEKDAAEEGYQAGKFIDLGDFVEILDRDKFVKCYRIICNPDKGDWAEVVLSNGRVLTCTMDHPWSVNDKGVVLTKDLSLGDEIEVIDYHTLNTNHDENVDALIDEAWLKGFILCDGCYDHQMMCTVGADESDIAEKYCLAMESLIGSEVIVNRRERGVKGTYLELKSYLTEKVSELVVELQNDFGAMLKSHRSIPQWVFEASKQVKLAFLAGMVDADGYINDNRPRAKVHLGSTNKVLSIQTMLLAQSCGMPAKMYINHYNAENPSAVRYRVEFDATSELIVYMASQKKKAHFGEQFAPINFKTAKVTAITPLGIRNRCSYDVTTESEHFNVSGIRSHNCRTRVFENRHGEKTSVGRGNLSFSTVNLPGLALSVRDIENVDDRVDKFFTKLYDSLVVMGEQLYDRYNFQCTATAKQFPLLMSGMWEGSEVLSRDSEIRPVLLQGTLGMGFIGLAECLVALIGQHHAESEEAQELGLKIVRFIKVVADAFASSKNLNYSVIATPAEGLSGKFTKKDKKKYGIIEGITDKDYYTNSNHVPVYYNCSASHKAAIEAPYHELTRGGHIFYVEMDGDATHNTQAIMDIVDLMDKYNIGYGSINHNRNRCMDCGYENTEKGMKKCSKCGSKNIDTLQRITGYLVGTTQKWNSGKLAELKDRVVHD
jgi:ribonucleoside-triphosphate reductase (formate)